MMHPASGPLIPSNNLRRTPPGGWPGLSITGFRPPAPNMFNLQAQAANLAANASPLLRGQVHGAVAATGGLPSPLVWPPSGGQKREISPASAELSDQDRQRQRTDGSFVSHETDQIEQHVDVESSPAAPQQLISDPTTVASASTVAPSTVLTSAAAAPTAAVPPIAADLSADIQQLVRNSIMEILPTITADITRNLSGAIQESLVPCIADAVRQALVPLREEIEPRIAAVETSMAGAFPEFVRLWSSVEWQDQGSRAGALKIFGVPHTPGENLRELVKEIGNKINVPIDNNKLTKCHRVKAHNGTAILCQFSDEDTPRKLMKEKKELAKSDTMRNVKIFESLTGARSAVMRKLNANPAVSKIWTIGGKLKVCLRKAALNVVDEQRVVRCMEASENEGEIIMTVGHFDHLWKLVTVGFDDSYISELLDCAKRGKDEF